MEEEIYSLDHFSQAHVPYFHNVTFNQRKDTVAKVLNREKSTSLSKLFKLNLNLLRILWSNGSISKSNRVLEK